MNKHLNSWLKNSKDEIKNKIKQMSDKELEESFGRELEFGTAGIRGIIGIGPNKMNLITVAKAAYGYAKYIIKKFGIGSIVIIGTDNRHMRNEFADITASVLSSFGITVYYKIIIPTPMVSFAIREMGAQGGVIITASHNPPEYNGFKVYDEHGGQLLPNETASVLEFTKEKDEFVSYAPLKDKELINELPDDVIKKYENKILQLSSNEEKRLKIVFSPQHGTSAEYLPNYLEKLGYEVIRVSEQMTHDPDFSKTKTPNPENEKAYELAIKYARENNADLIITTDPDADRIGVAALKEGKYKILNGNEFAEIAFFNLIKNNKYDKNSFLSYSYVSSTLPALMAEKNNIESIPIATGFKWISSVITKYPEKKFLFGFEESYGCLFNDSIARDKDSFQAAVIISDIANAANKKNKTIWNILEDIYEEYGYFKSKTLTKSFKGLNSNKLREDFISNLRNGYKLETSLTYKIIDVKNGLNEIAPMDMIRYEFDDGSWIAARPSGTEPKIKFYSVVGPQPKEKLEKRFKEQMTIIKKLMEHNEKN